MAMALPRAFPRNLFTRPDLSSGQATARFHLGGLAGGRGAGNLSVA